MDDKQLLALAKKNAAKPITPKGAPRRTYDSTLDATRATEDDLDVERKEFFKEMKRRGVLTRSVRNDRKWGAQDDRGMAP